MIRGENARGWVSRNGQPEPPAHPLGDSFIHTLFPSDASHSLHGVFWRQGLVSRVSSSAVLETRFEGDCVAESDGGSTESSESTPVDGEGTQRGVGRGGGAVQGELAKRV